MKTGQSGTQPAFLPQKSFSSSNSRGRGRRVSENPSEIQRRYGILLVSCSEQFSRSLLSILPDSSYAPVVTVSNVADAKRRLLDRDFDVVLINTPLPDEFGTEFAFDICSEGGRCALLFVRAELYAEVNAKAIPHGVLTLPKPAPSQLILQSLGILCSVRERLRVMERKTASVEEKMQEIRIVNHAKLLLMEQLKMTESEAHRYIEKQAMDRCVTRRSIAESIISARKG